MKRSKQLVALGILFVSSVSCKTGLIVTGCVVDASSLAFQCIKTGEKEGFTLSLDQGEKLICSSPDDTERFLVACRESHVAITVEVCSYQKNDAQFKCTVPGGGVYYARPQLVDNYYCLSPRDRSRVVKQCSREGSVDAISSGGY